MNLVLADLALRATLPDEADLLLQTAEPDLPESAHSRFEQLRKAVMMMLTAPGSGGISATIEIAAASTRYQPEQALELLQSLESVRPESLLCALKTREVIRN